MNAYWKYNLKYSKRLHLPVLQQPIQDLQALTSGILDRNDKMRIGRSWKVDELRLKSDSDLHKLWYVLLKERLALKSDQYMNSQDVMNSKNGPLLKTSLMKAHVSMSRLRSVVGERNIIRNEFMTFLEFYYIRKKQIDPNYILLRDKSKNKKEGEEEIKVEEKLTEEVKIEKKIEKEPKKKRVVRGALSAAEGLNTASLNTNVKLDEQTLTTEDKKSDISGEPTEKKKTVSVLDDKEKLMVEKLKKTYKRDELIKEYVSNSHMLHGKQKRHVKGIIDATRASAAKQIFMKEMAALSYKVKNSEQSKNPSIRKLENLL